MKTCPICGAKAVATARTCFECYYRFSDRSTRDVKEVIIQKRPVQPPQFSAIIDR